MTRTISVGNITWRENQVTHIMSIMSIEVFTTDTFTKSHFFTFLRNCQCKWMFWSIDSRTIIRVQAWNVLWTLRLLCCYCWHSAPLLRCDVVVPLIKSFYLLQRRIKWNCLWNVNCCTQKREIKVIQNINFAKSRNLSVAKYAHIKIAT